MTEEQYRKAERWASTIESAILTFIAFALAFAIVLVNHLP
jgi:hypothetical protein